MTVSLHSGVYTDIQGLAKLRSEAGKSSPESLKETAKQFESIFIQMMLKSMREAKLGDGLFESDQGQFYQEMFDKQISLSIAEHQGVGLADILVRQLGGEQQPDTARAIKPIDDKTVSTGRDLPSRQAVNESAAPSADFSRLPQTPEEFISMMAPHAVAAGKELGVSPRFLLAQAALETGWGKKMIHYSDGRNAHNLFGIKADSHWQGDIARVPTLEYVDGVATRSRESFRAYDSYADSFKDYVDFLKSRPWYRDALSKAPDSAAFIDGIHQAGYSTDPDYARKIKEIAGGDIMQKAEAVFKVS